MSLRKYLAYTLLEVLVTVAVIGGVASGAYLIVTNATEASARAKLEQDVKAVNRAIQVYQTHGGRIPAGQTGDAVLARLRREAANPRLPGLQGSLIDPRMTIRWQKAADASGNKTRAYWDATGMKFYVAESGGNPGVEEFYSGDVPAPLPMGVDENGNAFDPNKDDRTGLNLLAAEDKWVWDYNHGAGPTRDAPDNLATGLIDPGTGAAPASGNAVPLDPPLFSVDSGQFPISWFPGSVELSLPPTAPPSIAEIYYHVTGGPWQRYGGPVTVDPGVSITAKSVTLDPDHFEDSSEVSETYNLVSLKLEITASFPRSAYNYRELGGVMQGAPPVSATPYGMVQVTNLADIRPEHLSSDKFQIYWTYDGSDPALPASVNRVAGTPFAGSYNGTQLPVDISRYTQAGTVTIRVKAVSLDAQFFRNSDEQTITLSAEKLKLPAATMRLDGANVVISTIQDPSRLPPGTRIFFTDDGSDPGDNAGEPLAANAAQYKDPVAYAAAVKRARMLRCARVTQYTAPVQTTGSLREYNARTYPPLELKIWFDTGDRASIGTGTTPEGYYFAVGGGDNLLYQFDTTSGSSIIRTSECLYPPAAVAFLQDSGRAYYVEQASGGWNLGRYDLTTGTHAASGRLTAAGLDYAPSVQPQNLVGYNGSLYYVQEDTDDLVRVDLASNGSIRAQYKFADIAEDLLAFHGIGDVAADSSGTLYIASQNAWGTFNLKAMSGFAVPVNNPEFVWSGLVTGQADQIYGVRNTEPGQFYAVNKATGAGSSPVVFSPTRTFTDFGGPLGSVPFQMPPGHFAISPGSDDILRLNLDTGRNYIYSSNIGIQPTAIAADNAAGALYAIGPDAAGVMLKRVIISTGEITTLGNLMDIALSYRPLHAPSALTWYAGSLYYMAPESDDLVKITLTGNAVAAQTKAADILEGISIHPILGTVDGMTVGPDGQLYLASSTNHILASYDIGSLAGFSVIKSAPESTYMAITYRADKQMFGIPATNADTRRQIFAVDDNTGAQTYTRNVIPSVEISDVTGLFDGAPTPVNSEFFAVDGTSTRIYRFDPETGANSVLTATAPYPMGAVAYDSENQRVYYVSRSSTQVGVFNIATSTHSAVGNLNSASLTYSTTTAPQNLTFFNGSLYYVPSATDDLVRIDLNQSNTISDVWKEADLNGNASFADVGDLAVDGSGMLYLSQGTVYAKFDMRTLSGYTVIDGLLASPYDSLFSAGGTALYGLTAAAPRNVLAVSMTDGTVTAVSTTSPARNFIDAASAQQRVNVTPPAGAYYASATGRNAIYRLDIASGALRPLTANCPVSPEALALNGDRNVLYYTETTSSNSVIGLYEYDISAQRHVFVGNLAAPGMGYSISSSPHNLVYFAGDLYCIPSGDDLVRLNFTAGQLSSLTKFADISGNSANLGNVGALAVDNTGIAWVSRDNSALLGKFNFYTRSSYSEVNTTDAQMTGLVFSPANVLYGTHNSTPSVLQTVNQTTGARTLQANTSPARNLKDITGLNSRPRPQLPECYAVGGDNSNIYRFDPVTGVTYIETSTTPFHPAALARNPTANVLYYLENADSNWRLGRYDVAAATHTIIGTIGNGAWNYSTATRPENLFFYDGQLYYIASGSDDLVQITLNAAGTAVTGVIKAVDITEDNLNLGNVGDVAVDSSGRAWVATGNSIVGQFSMVTLSGYTQLSGPGPNYTSLLFNNSGVAYGSHIIDSTKVYAVDPSTGGATLLADTFPSITFWDMAGNETSVPYSRSNSLWGISTTNARLGEFVNWNLPNASARNYGAVRYLSGGVITSFSSGAGNIESLAITQSGTAYFVRNEPTVIGGVTYKRPLFSFETSTLNWSASPTVPVASFIGDLEPALSVLGAVLDTADTDEVLGLSVGPDQRLWAIYNRGNSAATDYLLRLNSFSTGANAALNNVSIIGALNGSGKSVTFGQDLVFSGGTLYVSDDADDEIYTVDYTSGAITGLFSTEAGSKYEGMAAYAPTGEIVGSNTESGTSLAESISRVRSGANNDLTRFNYGTLSGGALINLEGISFATGTVTGGNTPPAPYFAVNRTNSIFRVDPSTGVTTTLTASAPFTLDAIAYDSGNGVLYYIQNSNTTIQLGKFTLSNNTHTVLGDLKSTGNFRPTSHPQHLIYYYGELFYIAGTATATSLIRVKISPAAILSQDALSRLSTSNWTVTAAALDNSGLLFFREGTNLRSYDFRRLGNSAIISSACAPYESLLFTSASGTFFGSRTSTPSAVESVNMTTGAGLTPVQTTPSVSLYDMSGAHSAPPQIWVNTNYYAIGGNNQEIYLVDSTNAINSLKTTTPLFSGIASIAANDTGDKAYYVQSGSPYALAVYNRTADTHTQLVQLASSGTVRPSQQPDNLTWFNGHLYWLQSNTDNLYKIELKADGTWSDTFQVADIANDDESAFGTVGDLAVDKNGWLYISGSNRLAKFNLASMNGYTTLALNPAAVWSGLMVDADGLSLYGVKSSDPGSLYSVNATDGTGTLIGVFDAARSISDLASPQAPVTSLFPGQRYFISQSSTAIYRLDLTTGRSYRITSQVPSQPTGIAHDFTNNRLFLTTSTGPGVVRLASYGLSSGLATDLGSLSSGWAYSPTAVPQALIYAQNALWYVTPQTDDLVKVTLTNNLPTAQAKVADISGNLENLGDVSALTISPEGAMYLSRTDGQLLAKYNFSSLSGYDAIRTTPKANHHGLTYDDSGVLHGVFSGEDTNLYTVNTSTGFPTFKVSTATGIYDITGLNTDIIPAFSRSLWTISRNGTNNQLVEVKNYDQPLTRSIVNWGDITYSNGSSYVPLPASSIQIYGLALSSSGVGYFTATGNTTISGSTYTLGLFKLDLGTLQTGVLPRVTFLGDLKSRLDALSPATGSSEGRWVTGMTIDPVSGKVYGMLLDGNTAGADVLFTINSLQKGSGNSLTDLSVAGLMSGTASITHGKALAFDRSGTLFAADYNDWTVDTLNSSTGADLGNYSTANTTLGAGRYSALAIDPVSGALIGTEFTTTNTRNVVAGADNDPLNFTFTTLGIGSVYAMSFLTWPAVLPDTPPAVYYAANATTTLYSFNATSGSTTPLSPVAPFQARSLAFDPQSRTLYYVENVSTGFRLGMFGLTTATHTIMGNLDVKASGSWSYDPSARPNNLEFYGGSLYYVHPNTDDLVRILISGNTIVDQVKMCDLSNNTSNFGGAVTELTMGKDGMLWISAVSGLYKYNLSLLTGFTTIAAGAQYSGIFWDQSGNELYGTTFASQTTVHSVNQSTGTMAPIAGTVPPVSFEDFGAYPPVPTNPVGTYYAVNGTRTLYLVDQLTGGVSAANGAAPFDMSSVCYDLDNNLVYYVEAGTDSWRIGRYNPATGSHTDMGRAPESGPYASTSGPQPNNLFVYNSQLYYVKPGTDDLMRIEFSYDASSLLLYYKAADISNNTTTYASIGDVAVSSAGMAYFATPSLVAKYDLRTMTGYQVISSTPGADWRALVMAADGQLYGVNAAQPTKIYQISQTNASPTFVADIGAGLQFSDFGGRHPRVLPQPPSGQVYMVTTDSPSIHTVNVTTGASQLITTGAPFNISAIAYDYDGSNIFYTEASDTTGRLGKYDLRSNRHSIVADLKTGWAYNASLRSNNLVYSNGDLYYIHKLTDDLVRISLSNGAVSGQTKVSDVTLNAKSLGDVGGLAIDDNGYLFITRQDAPLLARYNMARRSRYTELNTTDSQLAGAVFFNGVLYGSRTAQPDRVASINTATGALLGTSPQLTPVANIQDLAWSTPEFATPSTRYYATDRTPNIYQVDPVSGETIQFASVAPLSAEAIAYDLNSDFIYYLEAPGSGFRLGRYDADSSTNTVLGSLQQSGFVYAPADQPKSMVYYQGALYYIARNSDDLVKITLNAAGITGQVKVTDLTSNLSSWDVSAMAINNSGQMFFRTGASLYRCDLTRGGASLVQLSSGSPSYESLLFNENSDVLYGAQTATLTRADTVNATNGTATAGTLTAPAVNLYEMTGPNTAPAAVAPLYYAAVNTNKLYTINPVSAATAALAGTALYNFDVVAYDQPAGVVYYLENTHTSTRLGKYTISTGVFANIGQLVDKAWGSPSITLTDRPLHLVAYQGSLYFVRKSATAAETDDLIRVSFTTAGAISTVTKVADINANTALTDVNSATVDDSGVMYFSTTTTLCRYDLRNLSTYTVIKASFPQHNGLLFSREANTLYGAQNTGVTKVNSVSITTGVVGTQITTSPNISIYDLASGNTAPPPPWNAVPAVYVAGDFYRTTDSAYRDVMRLTPDGSVDDSFNPGTGSNSGAIIRGLTRTSNGGVVVGGDFTSFNGFARVALARLNGDGSLDTSFLPDISQAAGGTTGTPYTIDWSGLGVSQDVALNGTDTNLVNSSSALHGMSTAGGFSGFGFQTFSNVAASGVTMTTYYSQNMSETGGQYDGALRGPNLFGPSGSGASGGEHPDRRVVGPWSLRFNNDQTGTITPSTVALSFSEPVFLNQVILGGLSQVAGAGTTFGANVLLNGGFETGPGWTGTEWFPNTTHVNKKPSRNNFAGSGIINNWNPDKASWIQDATRAREGSRFLYLPPSDQTWNFCVGQTLTVGGSGSGRALTTGKLYRVRYSAVTFNPNVPTGAGATQSMPAVEYGYTTTTGGSGFGELFNLRDDATGLPAAMSSASNWDSLNWRNYTGYVVAPAVSSTSYNLTLWLSLVKAAGASGTASTTSGMLFDNLRIEEVLTTENTFEHAYVRGYSTPDGTGTPVAADTYANLSAQAAALLGSTSDPSTVADVNNVRMDNDTSTNVYHTIGRGAESANRHGKISMSYAAQPVRSLVISFWATADTETVGAEVLPRFDGALRAAGITASLSNIVFRRAAPLPGKVWAVAEQADGKLIIGGQFTTVNGASRKNIARLNANGTLDATFDPGTGPNGDVQTIEITSSGSILAGGDFTTWNGSSAGAKIALLTATGARDTSWTSPISVAATDTVKWIDFTPAGVYVGGKFSTPRNGIARLSMTGANDTAFNPGTGAGTATVNTGALLDDGTILIGGDFTTINAVARNRIAKLTAAGAVDTTFVPTSGCDSLVYALLRLPGSSYAHAGGTFGTYNGNTRAKVTVFNSSTGAAGTTTWGPLGMTVNAIYNVK